MAFWPIMMGAAFVLTLAGIRKGAWAVPAMALGGYVATRFAVEAIPPQSAWDEIAVCTVWLCAASGMMYVRAWVPGALFVCSALTYPAFVVFGVHIGWLSVSNVLAEGFAILALASIGGGYGGLWARNRDSGPAGHIHRFADWLAFVALGVAAHQESGGLRLRKV